jgi:hypothetical protein
MRSKLLLQRTAAIIECNMHIQTAAAAALCLPTVILYSAQQWHCACLAALSSAHKRIACRMRGVLLAGLLQLSYAVNCSWLCGCCSSLAARWSAACAFETHAVWHEEQQQQQPQHLMECCF